MTPQATDEAPTGRATDGEAAAAPGRGRHVAWAALGAASIPALWWAWSLPGAAAMFTLIVAAFVLWERLGPRGSWMALVVMGIGMSGLLGWQAATGSRCPEPGTRVYLKAFKPAVDCSEIRASAASMAALFGLVALIGLGAPLYARTMPEEDPAPSDR